MSCHSLLACRVSAERSAVNLMGIPLYGICCFCLFAFNMFSLYLIFFFNIGLDVLDYLLTYCLLPCLFFNFIYLFLAVLGLCFCVRAFFSCREREPLFIVVHGPLTITASLVAEHGLQTRRLSSCGSWAQLLRSMWDLPRPGLEPVSPALAGGLSTAAPPGKPCI